MSILAEVGTKPPSLQTMVRALNGDVTGHEILGWIFPDDEKEEDFRKLFVHAHIRNDMFAELVRVFSSCVSGWLDSGIDSDGIERPRSRKFDDSTQALLENWLKRHPPMLVITPEGRLIIERNGPPFAANKSVGGVATEMALWWFLKLLESPMKNRVARCANPKCQRYFLRQREPRALITRRVCCGECASFASGTRVQYSRNRQREVLVKRAAAILAQDALRGGPERTAAWLTAQLNRNMREDVRIKQNTVSRNWARFVAEKQRQLNGPKEERKE
jgi:hypothetical protein